MEQFVTTSTDSVRCQLCGAFFHTCQGEWYCPACLEVVREGARHGGRPKAPGRTWTIWNEAN